MQGLLHTTQIMGSLCIIAWALWLMNNNDDGGPRAWPYPYTRTM